MKKLLMAALVLCMCLSLAACGKDKNVVTGYKSGDVTLGQYKGLTYVPSSTEVTEEEIENTIKSFLENNSELVEVTDRTTVQNGDTVNIDYTGYMDGVAFDRGADTDFNLVIGSNSFIDGFESGLIGAEVGTTVNVDVTFPDPYPNNPDFSGKPAVFEVVIHKISVEVLPELTDELVAEKTDHESVAAYRTYVADTLKKNKESNALSDKQFDVADQAIANATIKKDLKEEVANSKANLKLNYDSMTSNYYGVDAATFFMYMYGMSATQFDEYLESQAEYNVKYAYLLSAIVEAENVTASAEEMAEYEKELLASYSFETTEELYAYLKKSYDAEGKLVVETQVKLNKAEEILMGSAVAVEK